ncbi:MAG: TetR family transcriptional regulator [Nocardioidaceae bacterium]
MTAERASNRRTGRRPGHPNTRAAILSAAKGEFAARGFDRVSVREIGRAAGVDPALVHHYFGSKDDLLLAALEVPFDPRELIPALVEQGTAGLGVRIATTFLSVWDDEVRQLPLVALVRSAMSSESAADLLRSGLGQMILTPVADAIGTPDAQLRASLVGSQLMGLIMARYLVRMEPVASAPAATVAAALAPTLQRYIDGPL